jgi:hypothetical protein
MHRSTMGGTVRPLTRQQAITVVGEGEIEKEEVVVVMEEEDIMIDDMMMMRRRRRRRRRSIKMRKGGELKIQVPIPT